MSVHWLEESEPIVTRIDFESLLYVLDGVAHRSHNLIRKDISPLLIPPSSTGRIRCREIMPSDLESIIGILTVGFHRDRTYWINAMRRLSEHPTPVGFPKYGYLLESNGVPVGVLLSIFTSRDMNDVASVRCNGSSLYVAPAFSGYAPLLIKRSQRFEGVTYLNITPARRTWTMLAALGYTRFSNGIYITFPVFQSFPSVRIQVVSERCHDERLLPFETDLLLAHAGYGCMSLICEFEGKLHPFVFGLYKKFRVPLAHLIYCRDQQDFISLNEPLRRFLMRHGYPFVVLDSNGPIPGLLGTYKAIRPKFWMGAEPPRLGDLAYTERVMFGF